MRVELLAATVWLGGAACAVPPSPVDAGGDHADAHPHDAGRAVDATVASDAPNGDVPGDASASALDAGPRAARTAGFAGGALPGPAARRYLARGAVIEDAITGLTWQATVDATRRSLADAEAHCGALVLEGHDDFRVPSRLELVTLLASTRSPTIDPIFEGTLAEYHWTRSLHPLRDTSASTAYFGAAEIVFALARDPSAVVRCVRGGGGEGAGPVREADGRVIDRGSGLRWDVLADRRSHADASAGCEALGLRLPTLDELAGLVDDTRSAPAIDLATLGGEAGPTWSSSAAQSAGERVGLDLSIGPSVRLREDELAWARCVVEAP
jgi:hypothetical protein